MNRRTLIVFALVAVLIVGVAACVSPSTTSTIPTTVGPGPTSPHSLPSSTTPSPATTATSSAPAASGHVVYAVGDDTEPGMETVSRHLANLIPLPSQGLELFLYLGDVRPSGSPADFQRYDSIWGGGGRDLRPKTASLIGNHETGSRGVGWIPYWSGKLVTPWPGSLTQTSYPYYTVKLGTWKFIILDTTSSLASGSPQYNFLVRELKEPGYRCIVCGHYPRWSNGLHGDDSDLDAAWKAMCDYGAVAYLSGHDHGSQVQPERNGDGAVVASGGCIQLIAAAGGAPLYPFLSGPGHAAATWRDDTHYAILRLTLRQNDFVADFIGEDGTILHSRTFALGAAQ